MRRVAILGSARASMKQVPWNDTGLEIWGLAWRLETLQRHDLGFEIHRPPWRPDKVGPDYVKRLASHKHPIVLHDEHPDIPNGVVFPHEEAKALGGNYFMSSVAYMIAYAVIEKVDEIHIYGVDMVTRGEYEYQRPNVEYWLGLARGMGIKVVVAEASALLRGNFRYGETRIGEAKGPFSQEFIQERINDYDRQLKHSNDQLQTMNGAFQECENTAKLLAEGKTTEELTKLMQGRMMQYQHQIRMGEAQANTTNGAKQEAAAMLDFQAHYDRGGVVPGAGQGVVNAARIDAGTTQGESAEIPGAGGPALVGVGPSPEANGNGGAGVLGGPAVDGDGNGAANGKGDTRKSRKGKGSGRPRGRVVSANEREESAGQESLAGSAR